jgi:tRNA(fMet)-specific endonuclease VapC
MIFALDTNILSELLKSNPRIVARFDAVPEADEVVITVVSWFEVLRGRMASILTAADAEQLLTAQTRFVADRKTLERFQVLDFTIAAGAHFERLLTNKKLKKIGRADLLSACIALAHRATLVTRNLKDFKRVPGLAVENWAD